jgi:hypothetical protein
MLRGATLKVMDQASGWLTQLRKLSFDDGLPTRVHFLSTPHCRYVNCLVDDSIENWRTDWYDRYQRYFVGVL